MTEASNERLGTFTLTRGGPFFRLARRLGLTRPGAWTLVARTAIALGIAFVPLVVLAAYGGVLTGNRVKLPLVDDLTVYARFLLAIPLLIQVERFIDPRLALAIDHFRTSDLLEGKGRSDFEAAVVRLERARDAFLPEILILVGSWALAWYSQHATLGPAVTSWRTLTPGQESSTTWAGRWFQLVSMPIFTFLIFRWLWRIFLWSRFLTRVSRTDLKLIATHPDGAAGLSFIGAVHTAFGAFLMPVAASVSARGVQWVQFGGGSAEELRNVLLVFAVIALAIVLGPLQVFVPKLLRTKRDGLLDYAKLAIQYTRGFDRKWVRKDPATDDPLLGSADIQSLADLANSYEVIRRMRVTPLSRRHSVALLTAAVVPMLPFMMAVVPLEQMLKNLAQLVMR